MITVDGREIQCCGEIKKILKLLVKWESRKFEGEMLVKFNGGKPVLIRKIQENIKVEDLSDD